MKKKIHYTGLTEAQVTESRSKHGANILTPPEKEPLWRQFLEKFRDPLIVILLIAGALSVLIACYEYYGLHEGAKVFFEPVGIFVAIILATGLAFHFEQKADREFTVLNRVNDDEAVEVIRSGNTTKVPRRDIVVGDIVIINTGDEVPADAVLLESAHLHIDESTLTGEPICYKTTRREEFDDAATYPTDHLMKGTKVMEGHGVAQVTAVGDRTEQGKVFKAAQIDDSVKTPLNEQLARLGRKITIMSYTVASLIVVGRMVMYFVENGDDIFDGMEHITAFVAYLLQTFMIAVTLIVVSVPEGLPMAVTLSLAYSMRRMLKTNNLVRRMHACETMGAATVICTDKTGTLTQNLMSVEEMVTFGGTDDAVLKESIAVNSTASLDFSTPSHPTVLGNPTEGALLLWLNAGGTDYRPLREGVETLGEVPFSTERKYMATLVRSEAAGGRKMLYVKGAPEILLDLCDAEGFSRDEVMQRLAGFQNRAMRTLAFACQTVEEGEEVIAADRITPTRLRLMAIAAIADPVRGDVPAAVRECMDAGIKVKIVTGDTSGTAREIARQIGLWDDAHDNDTNMITGPELAALSDDELRSRIGDIKIISRARPMDKKRLVETLQAKGEVVAVTGDGTNDAPALRAAHVGLSMGDGTSVAKEASDITIIDNSFTSICKAVMWGRSLFRNIQRFLLFQLTVNVTACLLVLSGAFMGTDSPLTVTQMLWINLIMDTFAATALASLPPSESVMRDRPRKRTAFIITRSMAKEIIGVGTVFYLILVALLYIFKHADITQLTDLLSMQRCAAHHLTPYELTLLFTIFVMTHFFYLFNARAYATHQSALHFRGCKGLLTVALIIFVGQVAMVELPGIQQFFNVTSLKPLDWLIIIAASSLVLWVREGWRAVWGVRS